MAVTWERTHVETPEQDRTRGGRGLGRSLNMLMGHAHVRGGCTHELHCFSYRGSEATLTDLWYAEMRQDGHRKLKYIHAWVWLETWPQKGQCTSFRSFRGASLQVMRGVCCRLFGKQP